MAILLKITDISRIDSLLKSNGALTAFDNNVKSIDMIVIVLFNYVKE
jgi:cystathionine beta-lyase/cystathionine gamma-synthase